MNFLDKDEERNFPNEQSDILRAILRGGQCVGYEDIPVNDLATVTLTKPAAASYALIALQADTTAANKDRAVHFTEDGSTTPTTGVTGDGMPLGDNGTYSIKTSQNITNFEAIGIEAGKTHTLRVQYYA